MALPAPALTCCVHLGLQVYGPTDFQDRRYCYGPQGYNGGTGGQGGANGLSGNGGNGGSLDVRHAYVALPCGLYVHARTNPSCPMHWLLVAECTVLPQTSTHSHSTTTDCTAGCCWSGHQLTCVYVIFTPCEGGTLNTRAKRPKPQMYVTNAAGVSEAEYQGTTDICAGKLCVSSSGGFGGGYTAAHENEAKGLGFAVPVAPGGDGGKGTEGDGPMLGPHCAIWVPPCHYGV